MIIILLYFFFHEIVEIDETPCKWSNGEEHGDWVIGFIGRKSKKLYLELVKGRSNEDLIPPIKERVHYSCPIITDALATYNELNRSYLHVPINKKQEGFAKWKIYNYLNTIPIPIHAHVNHIEASWRAFRSLLHRHHSKDSSHVLYVCYEYMFRRLDIPYLHVIKSL